MLHPTPTARLILRHWRDEDFPAFARMNADPRVMEYFPAPLSLSESAAFFDRILREFETEGFGLYTPSSVARTGSCWVIRDFTGSRSTDRCTDGWKSAGDCAPKCGATVMPRKLPEAAFGTPACRK